MNRRGCLVALVLAASALAQQKPLSLESVLGSGGRLRVDVPQVLWHPAGTGASLRMITADGGQAIVALDEDCSPGAPELTAADARMVLRLGGRGPARIPPCEFVADGVLRYALGNRIVTLDLAGMQTETRLQWPAEATSHLVAPGDARVAYLLDHQLWTTDRDGLTKQLTADGSTDIVYGGAAHRAEFGITTGLFWSPNGRYLAFSREDMRPIAPYPYQNLGGEHPEPRHGRYPMAGLAHSKVTIGLCDTTDGNVAWLEHDPATDLYWTNVAVRKDGKVFVALVNRGQDHVELARFDGRTGKKEAVLVREHDREWLEPQHPPAFLADGRFLWWSRRGGFRHLWLCAADGEVLHQVTRGPFDVQQLLDHDEHHVWFQAAGEDPRQLHLFCAKVDGSGIEQLTKTRGTHRARLSPNREQAAIEHSSLETPPHAYVLDLKSGEAHELPAARNPQLALALPQQRFFEVKADDGAVLYGHVAIPADLPPGEKAPVLLYVYGGPGAQLVRDTWLGGAALWLQALAAEGFVLCRLDNRGTPNRGIEFEQAIFRQLGTIECDDQLKAIEWLRSQPFADTGRTGVHGWSYGGYMTLRLLLRAPEVFTCGVSGAPVTDWRMYETGYTERYMDTPKENAEGYETASCLPLAGELRRPLLLVHGTDDKTVMWSHTLRFVDACVDAGTELSYFPYMMQDHGLRGIDQVHFLRMLRRFMHKHLHGAAK